MSTLRRRLRQDEYHVFHFVGHGQFRPDWGSGVLVMEDRNGSPHEVTGEELGGLLNEYDATRLAVLNACEGGRTGVSDPFSGMAQSLIQQGLPAVVAMQFAITDEAAIIFARELYGAIADGFPLEAALAEARGAIRDEGNLTEWGTPVLYSRAPDGHLFDLTERILRAEAGRAAVEDAVPEATPLTQRAPRQADVPEPARMEHHATDESGTAVLQLGGVVILRLSGMKTADAEQVARTLLDLQVGPHDLRSLLVLDETALLAQHAPAYVLLQTAGRAKEILCVAVGPGAGNNRTLRLPGNLGGARGVPVLWVGDPAGIDWRVTAEPLANRHPPVKASGLDHLLGLLAVEDIFKLVHTTVAEKIPGRLASPGLWLAGAQDQAAIFAAALAVAIRRLSEPGPGPDGPFPALLPSQAGGASLAEDAPLARYRNEVAESAAAASGALKTPRGFAGLRGRNDDAVYAHIAKTAAALTGLRDLVAQLLREANTTGELTRSQRTLLARAGIRFTPRSAPAQVDDLPVYQAIQGALRGGDALALVARRLTLTERELRRYGSASYLEDVDMRCPQSLLDRLAHPPQQLPAPANAKGPYGLGLPKAIRAAGALADLVIAVADREWSAATPSPTDLSRAWIALDGTRQALEDYAGAARDVDTARGTRLKQHSESLIPALRELVLRVVATELASPSAHAQDAQTAARNRTAGFLAEWAQSVQANGLSAPPPFASSTAREMQSDIESDLTAIREALSYPASEEMWQLCGPDDLMTLDAAVPPLAVRFAPRTAKEALAGTLSEEPVWTSSGSLAGLVRLIPLRPGAMMTS